MRVLLTGAGGQVGRELTAAFADHDTAAYDRDQLDVTDRASVIEAVAAHRADVVVHPAAWTAVDACEADPEHAFHVNALGTRHVAEAAARGGARLVYLSTDYVFDGTKPGPYHEWDEPNPTSVYGRSKLAGEREALAMVPGATVVRTSWVSGFHGANMVKTILRLAGEQTTLHFVDDQRGCPTFADDLAVVVRHLALDERPGTFHVTNQGAVSWYEFARAVFEAAGYTPDRIEPVSSADIQPPRAAPRPANSVLDNVALRLSGVPLAPDFHQPLARLVAALI